MDKMKTENPKIYVKNKIFFSCSLKLQNCNNKSH
jgi:hypothetical protein